MSQHGDKRLQTVQLAYDDNSEDTLRLHNQQQQQQSAGKEWDNWEQQPQMGGGGGPRNVRIVSIENENLLKQQDSNVDDLQGPPSNSAENPLYKVGLKLNKKQANLLRNNGYQSAPDHQGGFDDGKMYKKGRPRSLCFKISVGVGLVCLLILILGLAIGIPVSHKKGKLELPKKRKSGTDTPQVRNSQGQILTAAQLQQNSVVEIAHDVCCPDRTCEVGYPGQPINPAYSLRVQAFGQNATTNSTPSVIFGPGVADFSSPSVVIQGLKALFYPYYHDPMTQKGTTLVNVSYDPVSLVAKVTLSNNILTSSVNYTFDKSNGSTINGMQLRLCVRSQSSVNDLVTVGNLTINGTNMGSYPGKAQGSCEEYYFSGRYYQGFNMSFMVDYGLVSSLEDSNNVDIEWFKYAYISPEVCAFTIGDTGSTDDNTDETAAQTVQNSNNQTQECQGLDGCMGIWDLDTCLKGDTSLSTATSDLNNQFGKAVSGWNVTGCISIKQKSIAEAVQSEICPEACMANETVVGLRMIVTMGPNCNHSIITSDLYDWFSQYEQSNQATNFGGCEPPVKRVTFNNSNTPAPSNSAMAPRRGPVGKKRSLLESMFLY